MHKQLLVKGKLLPGNWESWLGEVPDEPQSSLNGSHMTVSKSWNARGRQMLMAASFLTEAHGTAEPFFIVRSCRTWKTLNWMLLFKRGYRDILFKLKNLIQPLRPVTALTPQHIWFQWSMVGQNLWSLVPASPQITSPVWEVWQRPHPKRGSCGQGTEFLITAITGDQKKVTNTIYLKYPFRIFLKEFWNRRSPLCLHHQ